MKEAELFAQFFYLLLIKPAGHALFYLNRSVKNNPCIYDRIFITVNEKAAAFHERTRHYIFKRRRKIVRHYINNGVVFFKMLKLSIIGKLCYNKTFIFKCYPVHMVG